MKKTSLHESFQLAWAIANAEACRAGAEEIEPVHFLLGVLKIIDDAFVGDAAREGLPPGAVAELPALAQEGRRLLGLSDDATTSLRRRLRRSVVGAEPEERPLVRLHRSPSARETVVRAAVLAAEEGATEVTVLHLLRALLAELPEAAAVFWPGPVQKPALDWETRIDGFVAQFRLQRIALVLTDIEGSMGIKGRFGDLESAKIFRAHDNLFRDLLAELEGGREIKTIGDAFLLAFASERDAVGYALVAQARLRANPDLARVPVRVRMGIFAGPVLERTAGGSGRSDPIFGITIDSTARVSALATGNQILCDRGVYEATREALSASSPEGLGPIEWRAHGAYRLKGLAQPVEIFEVGETGLAAFVTPPHPVLPAGSRPRAESPRLEGPVLPAGSRPRAEAPRLEDPADKTTPVHAPAEPLAPATRPSPDSLTGAMGRDLTALARAGRLAPVVGRSAEITALARGLERTSKRNVLLIGEAGVGKTAVVEGLALRLAGEGAPEFLRRLRIVQINVADLLAGTRYRGDLEERLRRVIDEVSADPDLVLFLDEIHLAVHSGAGEGALDVANILKPALARDDFRCIGATTTEEFERDIKNDSAFLRRFQLLPVAEPSEAEALLMCRQWAERIAARQKVTFDDDALVAAVELSARLLTDRRLPDKAVDLLDNAATYVKVSSLSGGSLATAGPPRITRREIESVLADHYGVTVVASRIETREWERALRAEIVGQEEAIGALVESLRLLAVRDTVTSRPLAVWLFVGPSGVGKGFTAECLARALFGPAERSLLRIALGEYAERHDLARLIGAPPGFVGHEQPGALFRFTEGRRQGVIVLESLDRAHPEVRDYFLRLVESGEGRDSRGRRVDLRGYVFVLTHERDPVARRGEIGFANEGAPGATSDDEGALLKELARGCSPEWLGQVDRVIPFRPLVAEALATLLERRLTRLDEDVQRRWGVTLDVESLACRAAAEDLGRDVDLRGFLRLVERHIIAPLLSELERNPDRPSVRIGWEGGRAVFSSLR